MRAAITGRFTIAHAQRSLSGRNLSRPNVKGSNRRTCGPDVLVRMLRKGGLTTTLPRCGPSLSRKAHDRLSDTGRIR